VEKFSRKRTSGFVGVVLRGGSFRDEVEEVMTLNVSEWDRARSIRAYSVCMLSSRRGSYPPSLSMSNQAMKIFAQVTCEDKAESCELGDSWSKFCKGGDGKGSIFLLLESVQR
jgi:hypothetical protein